MTSYPYRSSQRCTPPTHCRKCGNETMWPEAARAEEAANQLNHVSREDRGSLKHAEAVGSALAFLYMLAGCAKGLCIFCQDSVAEKLVATVEGGVH